MQSPAVSVESYLAGLPPERAAVLQAVREVILANLDAGFEEGMQYGMIGYYVPHARYPAGYHCDPRQPLPYAGLAAQKNHYSLYLCAAYCGGDGDGSEAAWFRQAWTADGRKLDMGKACVRFRRLQQVPLAVVGEAFRRMPVDKFIAAYEAMRSR